MVKLLMILSLAGCLNFNLKGEPVWYSEEFGFILIQEDQIIHFPRKCITPVFWILEGDKYLIDDINFESCQVRNKIDIPTYASIKRENDILIITGKGICFEKSYGKKELHLSVFDKISEELNFDKITVSSTIKGEASKITLTKKELIALENKDFLSIEDQLWMIFNSGVNYYSKTIQPNNEFIFELYLEENLINKTTINTFPCYLHSLLKPIIEKLHGNY